MVLVTPWNVKLTRSPSLDAFIPNSFSRSNSPVAASATASIIWFRSLPIADAVLPNEFKAALVGSSPNDFILMNAFTD